MLKIHRASRGDWLVAGLADLMADPGSKDPFAPEIVAVPTRGIERWLSQRLSTVLGAGEDRADGVCANVEFPFPGALVGGATAAATGVDPKADPWRPTRAVWPLLEVVDASMGEAWLEILATYLGAAGDDEGEARPGRRFSTVRHLADLFDRYGVHRPGMIRAWAGGDDVDAGGDPLGGDVVWQAHLWRRLRSALDVPSPAERLEAACERLIDEPGVIELPQRLSLFGLTRLPDSYLDVLAAIGAHRDVHLWLLHPSPALWSALVPTVGGLKTLPLRSDDPTRSEVHHPLLATWGRDAREMQIVLANGRPTTSEALPEGGHPDSLLGWIQADIRADREPATSGPKPDGSDPRPLLTADDRSVVVHACHGRACQVEVLHDAILHVLESDPTLQPRDVIVMCPDIDSFAPLIQATFGRGAVQAGGPDLHVRLADRSIRQTNPVLGAVAHLLDLAAAGRVTASDVLDLAATGPVQRRFHLDDKDMERIDGWVRDAGVRWGLDAAGREPYQLGAVAAGTWRTGLDRLLYGVVMSEDDLPVVDGVLPYDDMDSSDVELVGRLAELIDRLDTTLRAFEGEHPLEHWVAAISAAADHLMATGPADAWQHNQLRAILKATLNETVTVAPPGPVLSLADIQALLADRLRGRPTRANFRTGHLTMCTLVPMRSVPHRVVGLLGLDDGVFPRKTQTDGDDLPARHPYVGDRNSRFEDRQLLLDALLAAGDHLIVTYKGRDERTNAVCPPAVPVGELLDVIDRTVRTVGGSPARERVVVHHPLQSFASRNFQTGALVPQWPWSFDPVALGGAEALRGMASDPGPWAVAPLPALPRDPVDLKDLVDFVQHPAKAFLTQRLRVAVIGDASEPGDALPLQLMGLEKWKVADPILQDRLAGIDAGACRAAETVRGRLPPGQLGQTLLDGLMPEIEEFVVRAGPGHPGYRDVTVPLRGRILEGAVGGVIGCELRTVTYSRLKPKLRLAAWVRLLAVSAAYPEDEWRARIIGRHRTAQKTVIVAVTMGPFGSDPDERRRLATAALEALVELRDRGLCAPLPLACETSEAWAVAQRAERLGQTRKNAKSPWDAAAEMWQKQDWSEGRDAAHVMALGGVLSFDQLFDAPLVAAESGPGWAAAETTRFGRLARHLWDGLLELETWS
jgi:exodeoxyribonuclease V gamma subunit